VTRGTPAGILAQSQSAALAPIWLAQIYTGLGSPAIVYVTSWNTPVVFPASGGNTYVVRPFQPPGVALGEESGGDAGSIRLGDADEYWCGLKDSGAVFAGKRVVLLRTDAGFLSDAANVYRNDYWIDAPEWAPYELVLHLLPFKGKLRRLCPPDLVTRTLFPGLP